MRLFIIGNGFDIAHNLNTSYGDFRDYLEEENGEFLSSLEAMYGIAIGDWIDHIDEELWKKQIKNYLWRDFESNLSKIDEVIIYNGEDIDLGLEGGDIGIEDTLDEYWKQQYGFITKLNEYVMSWIKGVDTHSYRRTKIIGEEENDKFLTFNYTLVLEEIYNVEESNIVHIHGSIDENDISPVVGHGNREKIDEMTEISQEASEEYNEKRSSIYNAVARYYRDTFKDVPQFLCENKHFFRSLNEVNDIYIVGHSLGEVDIPYFKEIRNNVSADTMWNVYYYDEHDELGYREKVLSIGVEEQNIRMLKSEEFFNI